MKDFDRILDCGVSSKNPYTVIVADEVDEVIRVDIKPEVIEIQRRRNDHPNVTYQVINITETIPDERYDVVIFFHMLEHLDDPGEILTIIKANTDKITVKLPREDAPWEKAMMKEVDIDHFDTHDCVREYDEKSAKELLRDNGLENQILRTEHRSSTYR
jgi:hypothetical protein